MVYSQVLINTHPFMYSNLYQAQLMKMNYGGKELRLGRDGQGTVVFDSGSTYTYFTDQAYKALISMVSQTEQSIPSEVHKLL